MNDHTHNMMAEALEELILGAIECSRNYPKTQSKRTRKKSQRERQKLRQSICRFIGFLNAIEHPDSIPF